MSRKILILLALLVVGRLWGATFNAATGSFADVTSAANLTVDGDTVSIPSGTNHWTSSMGNSGKQITFQGAGTPLIEVDGTTVAPVTNTLAAGAAASTCIIFDSSTSSVFGMQSVSNATYGWRITGILFMAGTNTPADKSVGLIAARGTNKRFRIDHCMFWHVGQSDIYVHDWALGCIDHNIFWDDGNNLSVVVDAGTWADKDHGGGSWWDANSFGTTNAVYIEWNVATNNYSTSGILDGESGGRAVVRYNTMTNLPPVTTHGTDTGGAARSFRQLEYYGNLAVWETNSANVTWTRHLYNRGGSELVFSNASIGFWKLADLSVYRDFMGRWNPWAGSSGTNAWDTNSPTIYYTGTHNGATGQQFIDTGAAWIANQWATGYVALNRSRKTYGVVTANTSTTITCGFANGSQVGVGGGWGETNIVFASGDSVDIVYIDHSIDQAGLGSGQLIIGDPPLNVDQGNIIAWPIQVSEKCYEWSNRMAYFSGQQSWIGHVVNNAFSAQMTTIKTNIDYIDGVPMPGYTPLASNPLDVTTDPAILVQPAGQSVAVGQSATFNITVSGTATHCQWKFNGSTVGVDTTSYTRSNCQLTDTGGSVTCVVTGSGVNSPQTSGAATLTVTSGGGGSTTTVTLGKATLGAAKF